MTASIVNGVKMVQADVKIDQKRFLEAYIERCANKVVLARIGTPFEEIAFTATINGRECQAYIMYESEGMNDRSVVARYLWDTDKYGEWYDLIIVDLYGNVFSPRPLIRDFGERITGLGIHIDASRLLNQR